MNLNYITIVYYLPLSALSIHVDLLCELHLIYINEFELYYNSILFTTLCSIHVDLLCELH